MTSTTSSDRTREAPLQTPGGRATSKLYPILLCLLVCGTRLPLLGLGEPDSALFVIGARQWLQHGPEGLMIYSAQVCATYYAFVLGLLKILRLGPASLPTLMAAISFLACLGTVLLCYDLGAKLINRQSAFYAMLLFALSPGLWWTSIEPHPQIPSLFFAVLSLWCLARYLNTSTHPALIGASAISFGVAVAMKNDAVLLVPALFGLALFIRPAWRSCVICAGIVGASALVAYTLARVVLGAGTKALQAGQQTASSVLSVPGLTELLKQSTPIILGLGLLSAGLIAFSLFRLATGARQDRSWWLIIVSWSLPGYIFYLLVSGNNIRHVVAFGIPLFFIGAKYSKPRYIIACAVASFIIPANSNMVMYPSPNVPSSYGLFHGKMLKVQEVSRQLRHSDSCFVGSYTNDYIANDLLANGAVVVYQADVWDTKVVMQTPDGVRINLRRIDPTKRTMDPGSCRVLEYDSSGKKFHFLGSEWKLPIG